MKFFLFPIFRGYAFDEISATIPATINIGNAMYINPHTTIPISTRGNNTTVTKNFDIPQAALIPKNNIFPNIHIMQIANNSDNIFLPPLCWYTQLIKMK